MFTAPLCPLSRRRIPNNPFSSASAPFPTTLEKTKGGRFRPTCARDHPTNKSSNFTARPIVSIPWEERNVSLPDSVPRRADDGESQTSPTARGEAGDTATGLELEDDGMFKHAYSKRAPPKPQNAKPPNANMRKKLAAAANPPRESLVPDKWKHLQLDMNKSKKEKKMELIRSIAERSKKISKDFDAPARASDGPAPPAGHSKISVRKSDVAVAGAASSAGIVGMRYGGGRDDGRKDESGVGARIARVVGASGTTDAAGDVAEREAAGFGDSEEKSDGAEGASEERRLLENDARHAPRGGDDRGDYDEEEEEEEEEEDDDEYRRHMSGVSASDPTHDRGALHDTIEGEENYPYMTSSPSPSPSSSLSSSSSYSGFAFGGGGSDGDHVRPALKTNSSRLSKSEIVKAIDESFDDDIDDFDDDGDGVDRGNGYEGEGDKEDDWVPIDEEIDENKDQNTGSIKIRLPQSVASARNVVKTKIVKSDKWMLLHTLAATGHLYAANLIIKAGYDIELKDKNGHTALHVAVMNGRDAMVKNLLKAGASPHIDDPENATLLHYCAQNGSTSTIKYLVKYGIDINAQDSNGWTALHIAAQSGRMDVCKKLILLGANVSIRNNDGNTSLDVALQFGENFGYGGVIFVLSKPSKVLAAKQQTSRGKH